MSTSVFGRSRWVAAALAVALAASSNDTRPAAAGAPTVAAGGDPAAPVTVTPKEVETERTAIPTVSGRAFATLASAPACTGEFHRVIPVAARVQGLGGSQWRFDLGMYADSTASVDIAVLPKNQANPSPTVVNVQIPANEEVVLQNVLGTLFNVANAGLGLRYCSGYPLAEGYFYNVGGGAGAVYGATVPALADQEATRPFRPATFHNLSYSPNSNLGKRVNIGATSNSSFNVQMAIDLYDGPTLLGTVNHTLLPFEHRQFTRIHQMVGSPAVASGHAVVRLLTDEAEVYTYALQVQNVSGDLQYGKATPAPPPYGPIAAIFEGTWAGTWTNTTFASSGSVSFTISIDETAGAAGDPGAQPDVRLKVAGPPGLLGAASLAEATTGTWVPGPCIATMNLDLGGNVFGAPDPPPRTLYGYKGLGGVRFMGDTPTYGHYNIDLNEKGMVNGTLTRIPQPGISSLKMWGKVDQSRLNLSQIITFDNKSTAAAEWNVVKFNPIF